MKIADCRTRNEGRANLLVSLVTAKIQRLGGSLALPSLTAGPVGSDTKKQFSGFMNAVYAEGAISSRTKELMEIALSALSKCGPCVKIHIEEARAKSISEAVWMAISFGGAPTMMFYRSIMEEV